MVFSSTIFLFAFLPVCLFGYYFIFEKSIKWQNYFLLFCSIVFYSWGGVKYTAILVLSIVVNWFFALLIDKYKSKSRLLLVGIVTINILILFIFKYLNFTVENINVLLGLSINLHEIVLPLGISFYTFQGLSYVIDVYRGRGGILKNPLEVGLYIALFPQLVAGPIVRYETIAKEIHNRTITKKLFLSGLERFIIGLSKKAIIANTLAVISKQVFSQYYCDSAASAWVGAIAFTLQIYYDFSGYSDMAIGMGRMLGFHFEENFNYPYISSSISEFWRRWHISLGTWFRDYVYFPLGGSRVSSFSRVVLNLLVVWLITGIWHGANWTFIIWGALQFIVILIEKLFSRKQKGTTIKHSENDKKILKVFKHGYTMLIVVFGWVIFNSDSIGMAIRYFKSLLFIGVPVVNDYFFYVINEYVYVLIAGIVFSLPLKRLFEKRVNNNKRSYHIIKCIVLTLMFIVSSSYVVAGSYNPFIYFIF